MRFVEQDHKLPIVNADTIDVNSVVSKHGPLLTNTIRALIAGPSSCGKTQLIFTLLTADNGLKFENVYIYSKTLGQEKYKLLEQIIRQVDGVNLYTFYENETIMVPEKAKENSIFIFDDVISQNQHIIREYFSRGRHNKIDVFYLGQSYSKIPKLLIRDNSNLIVLFKQDELNLKHAYDDHCSSDMTFSEFKDFCRACWNRDKYGFAVICKDFIRDQGRYRSKFDTFALI